MNGNSRSPDPFSPTRLPQGVGGESVTLSAADLSNLPQQTVKVIDHGAPATFEGVLLTDVLAKVDLPIGEKFHSAAASYYLTVEARDGYRAVFARDGQALSDQDRPRRSISVGGAGREEGRKVGPAGDGAQGPANELTSAAISGSSPRWT